MGIISRFFALFALAALVYYMDKDHLGDYLLSYLVYFILLYAMEVVVLYKEILKKR